MLFFCLVYTTYSGEIKLNLGHLNYQSPIFSSNFFFNDVYKRWLIISDRWQVANKQFQKGLQTKYIPSFNISWTPDKDVTVAKTKPARRPPCVDTMKACFGWSRLGYCFADHRESFMREYCKRSCNLCSSMSPDHTSKSFRAIQWRVYILDCMQFLLCGEVRRASQKN